MAKESGLLCLCMSLMHNGWIEEGEGRKGDRGQKLPDQASQKVGGVLGFLLLSKSDYIAQTSLQPTQMNPCFSQGH